MTTLKSLKSLEISGAEVLPIIEGGKGVAVTNGITAGSFAASGAIGTFSGVNADYIDENGKVERLVYRGKTRKERHEELVVQSIKGAISQARIAHDISKGAGRVHMNVLWEMAAVQRILTGVLEGAKGLVHGVTCGAGMPYKVAEFAEHYKVFYYPIVSSMRAFRALWKRSYSKYAKYLGAVVYEDPWLAGGHNGLSNGEDPNIPENPYPRVAEIRAFMNEVGLQHVPIVMAGGVWYLRDWADWLDNPEIGPIAFQYGTRPILTKESPVPEEWKKRLLTLKEGDIFLNRYSPTGFYSSAVNNDFIKELRGRAERQIEYSPEPHGYLTEPLSFGPRGRTVYVSFADKEKADSWMEQGHTEALKTPDSTLIFVSFDKAQEIRNDQIDCMGCLSACKFSNWADDETGTTGKKADPRSYCIQKTLQDIAHDGDVENQLMFSGHNAYKFGRDPFYKDGFVPTVKQLVDRIVTGD